jgi:capsular polysaccharide biosynthesis protein
LELRRYLSILRTRVWFIVATVVLATLAGYAASSAPPKYVAQTTIYVGSRAIALDPAAGELSNDRATAIQLLVLTFSKMIDSEPIARQAAAELGIDRSARSIVEATDATPEPGTQLLYITVEDSDAAMAQDLANGLAEVFVQAVQEFEPGDLEGAVPRLPAYVFERAELPTEPVPTDQVKTILLSAVFGLLVSAGVAFLFDYLDVTIRTADDVERRLELPVLGVIPALDGDLPPERMTTSASAVADA